jgi:hypothetical protein
MIIRWARHVVRIGKKRNAYRVSFWESRKETDHLEALDVGGRIILK